MMGRDGQEKLVTILTVLLVAEVVALLVLVDVSRLPLRLRPQFWPRGQRAVQAPRGHGVAVPQPRPAAPVAPIAPEPKPAPSLPACTAEPAPAPSTAGPGAVPADLGTEKPYGPGRGYLEGDDPSFSPDGREVVFSTGQEIWISGVDGRSRRRLTGGAQPAWTPDGSRIAFTLEDDIWVIDPDGSDRRALTTDPGRDREPAWSPDGTSIAFISNHDGRTAVWIMRADGTEPRRVTTDPTLRSVATPSFSPDGSRLVFSASLESGSYVERRMQLMIVDTDGSGLCRLTGGDFDDKQPAWSTRGIAFYSYRRPQDGLIWLVQPDGTGLTQLPGTQGSDPAWSPDGAKLAFGDGSRLEVFYFADRTVRSLTQLNVVPVQIYVNPGAPNTIDPRSGRSVPVVILSAPWFDPGKRIDTASIRFGPPGEERAPVSCAASEINRDGVPDLVCEFDVAELFAGVQGEAVLQARGVDGIPYEGRDVVRSEPAR